MIRRERLIERLEPRALLSASMVADLNTGPGLLPGFWGATSAGETVFLSHEDGVAGWELYKTDGTTAGTVLVKDVRPGRDNSAPSWITHLSGGTVLFTADDGANGIELWKSDGTTAGTVMVKDINPGIAASSPSNLLNINGTIYFTATDGVNGFELWKTDGTAANTVMVKNIYPGSSGFPATPNSSSPTLLVNNSGTLFFRATNGTSGFELWKSDGTEAGTVMVKDIHTSGNGVAANVPMAARGGYVYFAGTTSASGTELWRSNGTDAGTTMVKEIYSSSTSSSPNQFTTSGSYVYFDVFGGAAPGLYRTDGTDAGTIRLFTSSISTGVDLNGSFVFSQLIPATPPAQPKRIGLYKTDGNTVTTIDAGLTMAGNTSPWRVVNGAVYFTANTPSTGEELWKTDGTTLGTQMVADIEPGATNSNPNGITPYGVNGSSGIIFSTFGGLTGGAIFRSNGTTAGTVLVKDINPATGDSSPLIITPFKNWVYFVATHPTYSATTIGELFRSDGTEAGTGIAVDLNPGPTGASINSLKVFGDYLYFAGDDASGIGKELWRTDGTSYQLVKNINPGSANSNPGTGVGSGNFMYFTATTAAQGEELWRTDGTDAGTIRLTDIFSGTGNSQISLMTDVAGTLYFTAMSSASAFAGLWKTDGFTTTQVVSSAFFSSISSMLNIGGMLYISGTTSANGAELYKIAPGGTTPVLVKDIASPGNSTPANLTNVDGTLYFSATTSGTGIELWKSDGTGGGTVLVEDIRPGSSNSIGSQPNFVAANGVLYFRADNGTNGVEIWRSDGTADGTYLLKDIMPASASSGTPTRLYAANGFVYFSASDENSLTPDAWRTDGTPEGTAPISRFPRGSFLSLPSNASFYAGLNGDVYYFFSDDTHGAELWKSEQPDFATLAGGGALTLTGTANNDVIDVAVDNAGGVVVTLNGMIETFAPGQVASLNVATGIGRDTLTVNSGSIAFSSNAGAATSSLTLRVMAGASATFNAGQKLAALILDGGSASMTAGGGKVLVLGGLTINGAGKIDLADNAMIIRGGNLAAVTSLIQTGYQNGTWLGNGITSSAAAEDETFTKALGFAINADLFLTEFQGVTGLDSNDVLVRCTTLGDADLNGVTNLDDFPLFTAGLEDDAVGGANLLSSTWVYGDFDYNGVVNLDDFPLFTYGLENGDE